MSLSTYVITILGVVMLASSATSTRLAARRPGRVSLAPALAVNTVECALQAFGTELEDKGIEVIVHNPGHGCGGHVRRTVTTSSDFYSGEAEVAIRLPSTSSGLCFSSITVSATLPYNCESLKRTIRKVNWGHGASGLGTCRVLEQKCGHATSSAAVPYIDMHCRRPDNVHGGRTEEMRLHWAYPSSKDTC